MLDYHKKLRDLPSLPDTAMILLHTTDVAKDVPRLARIYSSYLHCKFLHVSDFTSRTTAAAHLLGTACQEQG